MSVFYRLHQDQSTGTKRSGKWYARAVPTAVINTRQLAEIVQRNCTVKRSDVVAVIEEMVEVMKDQMQDSKRVKLEGFGSFKIGIQSKGANNVTDYDVQKHIKALRINFRPEGSGEMEDQLTSKALMDQTVFELNDYVEIFHKTVDGKDKTYQKRTPVSQYALSQAESDPEPDPDDGD